MRYDEVVDVCVCMLLMTQIMMICMLLMMKWPYAWACLCNRNSNYVGDSPEKSVKWTIILLLIFVCICCFSMWIMMVMLKMMTNVLPDDEFVWVEYKKRVWTQTPKSQPIPPNSRSTRNFPKLYKYSSLWTNIKPTKRINYGWEKAKHFTPPPLNQIRQISTKSAKFPKLSKYTRYKQILSLTTQTITTSQGAKGWSLISQGVWGLKPHC